MRFIVLPSSLVKDADPAKRTGPTIMDPLAYALHMKHMLAIVELAKLFSCFCEIRDANGAFFAL